MLLFQLSSIVIFIVTALLNLLIACQLPSHSFTTQCFLLVFVPIMSTLLMPKLISICPLSPLLLVNSGTLLVDSVFHFPLTWPALWEEYKDTFRAKLTILREISSSYFMSSVWVRSSNFVAFAWDSEMSKKKKKLSPSSSPSYLHLSHWKLGNSESWSWLVRNECSLVMLEFGHYRIYNGPCQLKNA